MFDASCGKGRGDGSGSEKRLRLISTVDDRPWFVQLKDYFLSAYGKYETCWDLVEFSLTAAVLCLLNLGLERYQNYLDGILNWLVFMVLSMKSVSLLIGWWVRSHVPSISIDNRRWWFGFGKFNMQKWAMDCFLKQRECFSSFRIICPGDNDDLHEFAKFCHGLVLDRDESFSFRKREELYRKWLESEQPCFVAWHDGSGNIIAASIILSLTKEAFEEYWQKGSLDAINIDAHHLSKPSAWNRTQYLLIDVVARNKNFIKTNVRKEDRARFVGIGFRTILYHISKFGQITDNNRPAILCSTYRKDLGNLLTQIGFEQRSGLVGNLRSPMFCVDLRKLKDLSPDGQCIFNEALQVINSYVPKIGPG